MQDASQWFGPIPQSDAFLSVSGLCKAYDRLPVLYPLSFSMPSGSALALLGGNGSGKTTLLRLLAGVSRPTAGTITVGGIVVTGMRGRSNVPVGLVGHDTYLYDELTGFENLRFFTRLSPATFAPTDLGMALDAVDMRKASSERVRTYSAGMKRRLGLARLLLSRSEILLLDEPHASLDRDGRNLVDSLVLAARRSGRAVIISSHDQDRVLELCDQAIVLEAGRVSFQGSTAEFVSRKPVWIVSEQEE